MHLSQIIDFDSVRADLGASGKRDLFSQLAAIAGKALLLDPSVILAAIADREKIGSTGFGGGVAIPHGKVAGLDRIHCFVARLTRPLDYQAIDGLPVDLIFLLLSPPDSGADHLKALAAISRAVRQGSLVDKLRGARSHDALAAVLIGVEERDAA
jgi:PTS system nitrogen regulatory IIA component